MKRASIKYYEFAIDESIHYPGLPQELEPYYAYFIESGHSIMAVPLSIKDKCTDGNFDMLEAPIPLKYLLEHSYAIESGYIFVDVPYDSVLGVSVPDKYYQFEDAAANATNSEDINFLSVKQDEFTLLLSWNHVTDKELEAVQKQPFFCYLTRFDDYNMACVSFQFAGLPILNTLYQITYMGSPSRLVNEGYTLNILLVDASNQEALATRKTKLSSTLSAQLFEEAQKQQKMPEELFHATANEIYGSYAEDDLIRFASESCECK